MNASADEPTPGSRPGSDPDDTISLDATTEPTAGKPGSVEPTPAEPAPRASAAPAERPPVHATTLSRPSAVPSRPPVRWAGIVWGVLLVVFAAVTLIVVSSPSRLAGVTVWVASLTPGAAWALWVALLGLVIVVSALLGAIGAAQRSRRRRPL